MNVAVLVLNLANLALIGALPRVFFRPGRLNVRWWITASPFFVAAGVQLTALLGELQPLRSAPVWGALSVLASATSILLIGLTLGTHREPLSLWHQENDAAAGIVTVGAYRRIRHPFYAAFLLALFATAVGFPHWITLLTFAFACVQLNRTAADEERRLLSSTFGKEYALYRERTGRFTPRLRARRKAGPAATQAGGVGLTGVGRPTA